MVLVCGCGVYVVGVMWMCLKWFVSYMYVVMLISLCVVMNYNVLVNELVLVMKQLIMSGVMILVMLLRLLNMLLFSLIMFFGVVLVSMVQLIVVSFLLKNVIVISVIMIVFDDVLFVSMSSVVIVIFVMNGVLCVFDGCMLCWISQFDSMLLSMLFVKLQIVGSVVIQLVFMMVILCFLIRQIGNYVMKKQVSVVMQYWLMQIVYRFWWWNSCDMLCYDMCGCLCMWFVFRLMSVL